MKKGRAIISEKPLITAPIDDGSDDATPKMTIRWRKKGDSFVLEQWKLDQPDGKTHGLWVEVPCVVEREDKGG